MFVNKRGKWDSGQIRRVANYFIQIWGWYEESFIVCQICKDGLLLITFLWIFSWNFWVIGDGLCATNNERTYAILIFRRVFKIIYTRNILFQRWKLEILFRGIRFVFLFPFPQFLEKKFALEESFLVFLHEISWREESMTTSKLMVPFRLFKVQIIKKEEKKTLRRNANISISRNKNNLMFILKN